MAGNFLQANYKSEIVNREELYFRNFMFIAIRPNPIYEVNASYRI